MSRFAACVVALMLCGPAASQELLDPATLQKAITLVQAQRNRALDAQSNAELRAALFAEENAKLKAELEQLKKKDPASDPPK